MSYFAGGTLCNLILDWPDGLLFECGDRLDILLSVVSFLSTKVLRHLQYIIINIMLLINVIQKNTHFFGNKHDGLPRLPTTEHQDTENTAAEEKI